MSRKVSTNGYIHHIRCILHSIICTSLRQSNQWNKLGYSTNGYIHRIRCILYIIICILRQSNHLYLGASTYVCSSIHPLFNFFVRHMCSTWIIISDPLHKFKACSQVLCKREAKPCHHENEIKMFLWKTTTFDKHTNLLTCWSFKSWEIDKCVEHGSARERLWFLWLSSGVFET